MALALELGLVNLGHSKHHGLRLPAGSVLARMASGLGILPAGLVLPPLASGLGILPAGLVRKARLLPDIFLEALVVPRKQSLKLAYHYGHCRSLVKKSDALMLG